MLPGYSNIARPRFRLRRDSRYAYIPRILVTVATRLMATI